MQQIIDRQVCPIMGIRVHIPLSNDVDVVSLCLRLDAVERKKLWAQERTPQAHKLPNITKCYYEEVSFR